MVYSESKENTQKILIGKEKKWEPLVEANDVLELVFFELVKESKRCVVKEETSVEEIENSGGVIAGGRMATTPKAFLWFIITFENCIKLIQYVFLFSLYYQKSFECE